MPHRVWRFNDCFRKRGCRNFAMFLLFEEEPCAVFHYECLTISQMLQRYDSDLRYLTSISILIFELSIL